MLKIVSAGLLLAACSPSPEHRPMTAEGAAAGGQKVSAVADPNRAERPPHDSERHRTDLDWQDLLAPDDRRSLDRLDAVWVGAVGAVQAAGYGAEMETFGAAVDPYAAYEVLVPPEPAEYVCRRLRLDAQTGGAAFVAFDSFRCAVATATHDRRSLAGLTDSPVLDGVLHPVSHRRMLFLGRRGREREEGVEDGGRREDPAPDGGGSDAFGVLEQIGDGHWRIVLPRPGGAPSLDVLEIWTLPPV